MFHLKRSTNKTNAQVISQPEQLIGLDIKYRDYNGIVFPGIRTGTVEAIEWRKDARYPVGCYFKARDCEYPRHTQWVFDTSVRWQDMPNIVVISGAA